MKLVASTWETTLPALSDDNATDIQAILGWLASASVREDHKQQAATAMGFSEVNAFKNALANDFRNFESESLIEKFRKTVTQGLFITAPQDWEKTFPKRTGEKAIDIDSTLYWLRSEEVLPQDKQQAASAMGFESAAVYSDALTSGCETPQEYNARFSRGSASIPVQQPVDWKTTFPKLIGNDWEDSQAILRWLETVSETYQQQAAETAGFSEAEGGVTRYKQALEMTYFNATDFNRVLAKIDKIMGAAEESNPLSDTPSAAATLPASLADTASQPGLRREGFLTEDDYKRALDMGFISSIAYYQVVTGPVDDFHPSVPLLTGGEQKKEGPKYSPHQTPLYELFGFSTQEAYQAAVAAQGSGQPPTQPLGPSAFPVERRPEDAWATAVDENGNLFDSQEAYLTWLMRQQVAFTQQSVSASPNSLFGRGWAANNYSSTTSAGRRIADDDPYGAGSDNSSLCSVHGSENGDSGTETNDQAPSFTVVVTPPEDKPPEFKF